MTPPGIDRLAPCVSNALVFRVPERPATRNRYKYRAVALASAYGHGHFTVAVVGAVKPATAADRAGAAGE